MVGLSASITFPQRCGARLPDGVYVHRYPSGWYRWSRSQGNRGRSGLRQAECQERGRPEKSEAHRCHSR